jgi:hypothetical protein
MASVSGKSFVFFTALVCIALGVLVTGAVAAEPGASPDSVTIERADGRESLTIRDHAGQLLKLKVRLLEASGKLRADSELTIDDAAKDLAPHLSSLPFARYSTVDSQAIEVVARQKVEADIADTDRLAVRVQYLHEDRIGIWLNWHDGRGTELLNTRLHISKDMPVVVGADAVDGKQGVARILAVTIEP